MATGSLTRIRQVIYPETDGKPMAETDVHWKWMVRLKQILQRWFAGKPMVYVSGNLLIYYVPGDKRRHVAPDVFVVIGVRKKDREYFLCWEEGKFPTVVIEVTSKSTQSEDNKKKFALYRDVFGVKEYFLFDPREEYLAPRLRGYRLVKGMYVPMRLDDRGRLHSKHLGLYLQLEGANLKLIDPATGAELLGPDELAEQERMARERTAATLKQTEASLQQTAVTLRQQQEEIERERLARQRMEELLQQKAAELESLRHELKQRKGD